MRYARQQSITGWDQQKLTDAVLAIAGTGPTAFLTALMATAMGFGRLVLFTEGTSSCFIHPAAWAKLLQMVNPSVKVYALEKRLDPKLLRKLPRLNGLVLAGNEPYMRLLGATLALDCPVLAGSTARDLSCWGTAKLDRISERFLGKKEDPLLAQLIAAQLVNELRKSLFCLPDEEQRLGNRHLLSLKHLAGKATDPCKLRRSDAPLALVGAGALGTWFGIGLGLAGIDRPLHIYDSDHIDESNLNRQVLFFNAVGRPKAATLASRLQRFFPSLETKGYGTNIDSGSEKHLASDALLVSCPDNFAARALLNRTARHRQTALLNGGTDPLGGSCSVYMPRHSACLSCRMQVDRLAEQERAPQSCTAVQASTVTSNAITGALMAWNLRGLLAGHIVRDTWHYDGRLSAGHIGLRSPRRACDCHEPIGII